MGSGPFSAEVFVGQRAEGFYVDLGAVFDLGDLRGFAGDHAGGPAAGLLNGMPGVNSTADVNVHTLALQIPVAELTRAAPEGPGDPAAVIGVWTTASRQRVRVWGNWFNGGDLRSGPWTQVSRLGNPLANELLIGIGAKDVWNTQPPTADGTEFLNYFSEPLLAQLLPSLYPGVFPNLAAYNGGASKTRPDIEAIFLTGIPAGVITQAPSFTNYNGTGVKADMLRLNTAIPPSSSPNSLGLLGLDVAGFPNGRRVFDDVATIALRAVAGATLGYVVPSFTADGAAGLVDFGLTTGGTDLSAKGTEDYLPSFPYLGTPYSGYTNPVRNARLGRAVVMEHLTGTSEEGSVVLDIGGDFGAAIVHTPASLAGLEIEIRREGARWDGTHVAVRARRIPGGEVYAALFPVLEQGDYEVRVRDDERGPVVTLAVDGARVSEARLAP